MSEKEFYKKPWYEYRSEAQKALQTIKHIFGNNPWHEHQKIVGYLEGYVAGMNFAERQIEDINNQTDSEEAANGNT